MSVAYRGRHWLARMRPESLFLLCLAVLVVITVCILTGGRLTVDFLLGVLSGVWLSVLGGYAFYVWRRGELSE